MMEDGGVGNKELLVLGVTRDMGRYIEWCDLCQRMKNRMEELAGKLKLSEVPEKL